MKECSKSITRRLADPNYVRKYFVGEGIDIGGRPDPLMLYMELFPLIKSVRTWDWQDGDAELMQGVDDATYDFVFASHCLEHLRDPNVGLNNWFRILKPSGHLVVTVPEEDLYEQGLFPSTFNRDHKSTWTVYKTRSWSDLSINVIDLLRTLGDAADIRKIEVIDASYRYDLPRFDQTMTPTAECAIEFVVRKRTSVELAAGGRIARGAQPAREVRLHLNQYQDDQRTLRAANLEKPPFVNDQDL